jgi:hypothetical protein
VQQGEGGQVGVGLGNMCTYFAARVLQFRKTLLQSLDAVDQDTEDVFGAGTS